MYKEVAVDPACIADEACFFALREQFGFEKGRYLIADSRRWLKDAMLAVKAAQSRNELKPIRAQTIKSWLNKAGRRVTAKERQLLLPRDRVLVPVVDVWNDWWLGQKTIRDFDVSVLTVTNPPQGYDFTQLSYLPNWQVSPSNSVNRTAVDIVSAIEPLLRIGKEILLVDNYFNLGANVVLVELLKKAVHAGFTRLTIVTTCDCASPERVWNNQYQSLVPADFRCEWLKVPDRYFHDRYLITETGAVKAGHGFSANTLTGTAAAKVNLGYCAYDEAHGVKQEVEALVDDGRASMIWSN